MAKFWVGGTGNWDDTNHWATSSGGSGGTGAPTSTDDATFDSNSFSANGQSVTVRNDQTNACQSLDMSGSTNTPSLTFASTTSGHNSTLTVTSNITIPSSVQVSVNMPNTSTNAILALTGANGSPSINIASDCSNVFMQVGQVGSVTATFTLAAALRMGKIDIGNAGTATFTTNNFDVTTQFFRLFAHCVVNLGSSTLHLLTVSSAFTDNKPSMIINNSSVTLNSGTSTISVESSISVGTETTINCVQAVTLNNVTVASGITAEFEISTASVTVNAGTLTLQGSGVNIDYRMSNYTNDKWIWTAMVANAPSIGPDGISTASPGTKAKVQYTNGVNVQNVNVTDQDASGGGAGNTAGGTVTNSTNWTSSPAPATNGGQGGILAALI